MLFTPGTIQYRLHLSSPLVKIVSVITIPIVTNYSMTIQEYSWHMAHSSKIEKLFTVSAHYFDDDRIILTIHLLLNRKTNRSLYNSTVIK